jgi:hypothetical protein
MCDALLGFGFFLIHVIVAWIRLIVISEKNQVKASAFRTLARQDYIKQVVADVIRKLY